jgi:hypothetical protein
MSNSPIGDGEITGKRVFLQTLCLEKDFLIRQSYSPFDLYTQASPGRTALWVNCHLAEALNKN